MKINIYLLVFGVIAAIVILAALSIFVFNQAPAQNVSLSNYGPAPNVQGIAAWINSPPLNLSQLRGKVVLIDFWTYSCINCIRSIPHLNAWYNAYGDNGLVIIGVSTPEFGFEHNYTNVLNAVERFGIRYPVALDNNYATWTAYNNHYWPADYLIDASGNVRYAAFGEGDYSQTEIAIRQLLVQAGYTVQANLTSVPLGINFSGIGSPEIYLGWNTARQPIGNSQGFKPNQTVNYTLPSGIANNTVYFSGSWYNAPDGMVSVNDSKLFLVYRANKVNVVAGGNSTLTIKLDGSSLQGGYLGADDRLVNGTAQASINAPRLYNVVSAPTYGWHTLEIDASPGFKIYTFTFG